MSVILPCRGRTTHPAPQGSGWTQEAPGALQRAAGTTGAWNRAEPRALHGAPGCGAQSAGSGPHLGPEDPWGFVLLSYSFIHSLAHSFTHSFIYSCTHSLIHLFIYSCIHSLMDSLIQFIHRHY